MKTKKSSLGDRMKRYEHITRNFLQPRTYTIIRIKGKAFPTSTQRLNKPFDDNLSDAMVSTTAALFNDIQGAKYAYTQEDEISLILTDFVEFKSLIWLNGNIQKIVSASASIATVAFNKELILRRFEKGKLNVGNYPYVKWAEFDSRIFQLPNRDEVINYFIWRQQDAIRNSISALAQSLYSNKKLHKKNQKERIAMCSKKGKNWKDLPIKDQRGTGFYKWIDDMGHDYERHVSEPDFNIPIFSENRTYLENFIPDYI